MYRQGALGPFDRKIDLYYESKRGFLATHLFKPAERNQTTTLAASAQEGIRLWRQQI